MPLPWQEVILSRLVHNRGNIFYKCYSSEESTHYIVFVSFYYHYTLLNYINLGIFIMISICIEPEPGIIHKNDYSIENLYHMSDTAYLKAIRTHIFLKYTSHFT